MIIFDIPYAPLHPGKWSVDVSNDGHSEFKSRQAALRFAIGAALKAQPDGDTLINVEGVDGHWRMFDHHAKGIVWNNKRLYRIYWELKLNLRIKPAKRLVRERPQPLAVPGAINQAGSMWHKRQASLNPKSRQPRMELATRLSAKCCAVFYSL